MKPPYSYKYVVVGMHIAAHLFYHTYIFVNYISNLTLCEGILKNIVGSAMGKNQCVLL